MPDLDTRVNELLPFEAPAVVTVRWCPQCGRDDRAIPFTGFSHWQGGVKCSGLPIVLTYRLAASPVSVTADQEANDE